MWFTKLKILTTIALVAIGGAGTGLYAYHAAAAQQTEPATKQTAAEKPSVAVQTAAAQPAGVRQLLETMKWRITSVDVAKRTISVDDSDAVNDGKDITKQLKVITSDDGIGLLGLSLEGLRVAADAKVTLGGKAARFDDLKAGMRLDLKLAKDNATIARLDATLPQPPALVCVLQKVDAVKQTISVLIKGKDLAVTLPVAANASIEILQAGPGLMLREGSLQDLKPGMFLSLTIGPDREGRAIAVTEIKTATKK